MKKIKKLRSSNKFRVIHYGYYNSTVANASIGRLTLIGPCVPLRNLPRARMRTRLNLERKIYTQKDLEELIMDE